MSKPVAGDYCQYNEYDAEVVSFNEDEGTVDLFVFDDDAGFEVTIDYIPCHWFNHLNRY